MTRIAITALEVVNCGPWRGRHRVEFPPTGVAVFCAPNETGKTTLLRLIPAVLWDYEVPPRNWFAGEDESYKAVLEFERTLRDGHSGPDRAERSGRFRITRDFRTRRVSLEKWENDDWRPVQQGVHRRRGRTADTEEWGRLLQQTFAAISPEAFVRLAILSPPFDPEPEGSLVQSLIAGAGQNTKDQALEELLKRYRQITRFSREAGLSTADARNPGELDSLREEITELRKTIGEAERTLGEGLRLREEIRVLEEQIAGCKQTQADLLRHKEILESVRRLRRECEMLKTQQKNLQGALTQWKELDAKCREIAHKLAGFPQRLRASTPQDRQRWRASLEEYRDKARRLQERLAENPQEHLRRQYADVWDWPEDAPARVERLREAMRALRQAEENHRLAVSRLEHIRPVVDRRRQVPVVLGAAVAVALLIGTVGALLGSVVGGILAGCVGGVAVGLLLAYLYCPQTWPPEYPTAQKAVQEAEAECRRCHGEVETCRQDIRPWAGQDDLSQLLQAVGRYQSLCAARQALAERKAELARLEAELKWEAISPELRELCGLLQEPVAASHAPLSPEVFRRGLQVLEEFTAVVQQETSCRQQQAAVLKSVGVENLQALEERHRRAELDLEGSLLELRRLEKESPLAEEAFHWDGRKLENEVRSVEERLARATQELEELHAQRNDRERELARWEGQNLVNVALEKENLAAKERQIKTLENRAEAIAQAYRLVDEAYKQFAERHRQAIEEGVNSLMENWTGRQCRRFLLDEDFGLSFRIDAALGGDVVEKPDRLSQGARDQLALAIRWAVLDRLAGDVVLPLLLDDCFHMWDAKRRENLRRFLAGHGDRQIILVTHDEAFCAWGQRVTAHQKDAGSGG